MKKAKVHFRNLRLYINAGMQFPECYAYQSLLDIDKGALETTSDKSEITCKHCLRQLAKYEG